MNDSLDLKALRKAAEEVIAQMNRHEDGLPNTLPSEIQKLKEILNR